jgi:hypothetical protein
MDTTQSSQLADLDDTVRNYASSPCWMHEVDPSYIGYWSQAEVLIFLKSLLERERIGSKAFADIGKAADLRTADLILQSELDQASICVLLKNEIVTRGAAIPAPLKHTTNGRRARCSLEHAIESARSNQAELIQAIDNAVPNVFDAQLNSHLKGMQQLHRKQIEQLNTFRT